MSNANLGANPAKGKRTVWRIPLRKIDRDQFLCAALPVSLIPKASSSIAHAVSATCSIRAIASSEAVLCRNPLDFRSTMLARPP